MYQKKGASINRIHICFPRPVNPDGVRLNPRKTDLRHWRETFAEKLREQSIDANATPGKARGVARKAEK